MKQRQARRAGGSAYGPASTRRGFARLLVWGVLLLIGWQGLAVAPHIHPRAAVVRPAVRAVPDDGQRLPCVLCDQLAQFTPLPAPLALRLAAVLAPLPRPHRRQRPVWRRQGRSHRWRSRAPPNRAA